MAENLLETQLLQRRRVFRVLAASGALLAVAAPAQAATTDGDAVDATRAPNQPEVLFGVITSVASRELGVESGGDFYTVTSAPGADMYSGVSGNVTSLAAFSTGDTVLVEGKFTSANSLRATSVGSVFRNRTVNVESVDTQASSFVGSGTSFRVEGKLPDVDVQQKLPTVGSSVQVTFWQDPASDVRHVLLSSLDKVVA